MLVDVEIKWDGDFCATIFELPNGKVVVTSNIDTGWAGLFRNRQDWERANHPMEALETYDSVADAFADLVTEYA